MQLGEGWALQFHLHRRLSNKYPGAKFDSATGYLVERQREINFTYLSAHYENRYYLTFTYQLPPEIQQKSAGFFYKSEEQNGVINKGLFENLWIKYEEKKIDKDKDEYLIEDGLDVDRADQYFEQKIKVLFVLKESNESNVPKKERTRKSIYKGN